MQDVYDENVTVIPDGETEAQKPQSANADDTPDGAASAEPPEGLHFSFSSEEATPPSPTSIPAAPEAYLPVYNGQPVRIDATDVDRTPPRDITRVVQFSSVRNGGGPRRPKTRCTDRWW